MLQEHANGDTDMLCIMCSGGIAKWGETALDTSEGWCSWCFELTKYGSSKARVCG